MEQPKNKYILLNHRVGHTVERNMFGFKKSLLTNVLRGELLEALPEAKKPQDLNRIALVGIDRKLLRIECSMENLARLADEDANLLLAIWNSESRYQTLIDSKLMDFGRRLSPDSQVFVSVKGIPKDVVGVVRYKGELPFCCGTMFGVELIVSTLIVRSLCHIRHLPPGKSARERAAVHRLLVRYKIVGQDSGMTAVCASRWLLSLTLTLSNS